MKGVICYYSSTGNTRMAAQYIAKKIHNAEVDVFDIVKGKDFDGKKYDFIGFAYPVEYQGPPMKVKFFLEQLPQQQNKPAFLVNTYGLLYGKSMELMRDWVNSKGLKVVAANCIHMPENFPPLLKTVIKSRNAPSKKNLEQLNNFITELDRMFASDQLKDLKEVQIKESFINSFIKAQPRTKAREEMGEKFVDSDLCINCGKCAKECPYEAIQMNPSPAFNMEKCYGCWTCFNVCPKKAIYTKQVRGKGHYVPPVEKLNRKFSLAGRQETLARRQ